jgi:hypothetical protein
LPAPPHRCAWFASDGVPAALGVASLLELLGDKMQSRSPAHRRLDRSSRPRWFSAI